MADSMITDKQFNEIIEIIESSITGVYKACRSINVSTSAFYSLINSSPEYMLRYARAKEDQADIMVEDMMEIADSPVATTERGYDGADVQAKRLRVDTRKWLAAKLKPKKYGDHVDITSGGDKLTPPPAVLTYRIVEGRARIGADNAAD